MPGCRADFEHDRRCEASAAVAEERGWDVPEGDIIGS